jgi:hypothetical protein
MAPPSRAAIDALRRHAKVEDGPMRLLFHGLFLLTVFLGGASACPAKELPPGAMADKGSSVPLVAPPQDAQLIDFAPACLPATSVWAVENFGCLVPAPFGRANRPSPPRPTKFDSVENTLAHLPPTYRGSVPRPPRRARRARRAPGHRLPAPGSRPPIVGIVELRV